MKCSVIGCNNKMRFTFPKNKRMREKWLYAIQRPDFEPKHGNGICINHFLPDHILKESREGGFKLTKARLTKEAVPCIFSYRKSNAPVSSINFEIPHKKEEVFMKQDQNSDVDKTCMYNSSSNLVVHNYEECDQNAVNEAVTESRTEEHEEKRIFSEYMNNNSSKNTMVNENLVKNIFNEHHYHISVSSDTQDSHSSTNCRYSIEQFKYDPKGIFYFTGLENYDKFMTVFCTLGKKVNELTYQYDQCPSTEISAQDKLFLTLWKLRRNCSDYELSKHFCISEIATRVIFKKMVIFMASKWSVLDIWPTNEFINTYMPDNCTNHCINFNLSKNAKKQNVFMNLRPHVEKNIKLFKILLKRLHSTYMPIASEITGVCIMLCNFKEIIKK